MSKNLNCDQQTQLVIMCRILYQMFHQKIDTSRLSEFKQCDVFTNYAKSRDSEALNSSLILLNSMVSRYNEDDLRELQNDYNQLFVGPSDLLAPPWGSVYVDPYQEIFNDFTIKVDNFYRKNGLELDTGVHEPADHIGLMFAFLSLLFSKLLDCTYKNEKSEYYYDAINEFTSNYMLNWSDIFLEKVETKSLTAYYKNVAVLARCVLNDITLFCKK